MQENMDNKFEKAFSQLGETNPIFPIQAKKQMADMVEQIARSNENILSRSNTNQGVAHKAGFIAEEFHAETHNLDAILNNDGTRLYTDQYKEEWTKQGYKGNDNPDLIAVKNGEVTHKSQSKYYKDAQTTATKMRELKDGKIKYENMDSLLGPSDQINPQDGKPSIKEQAHKTELKENTPDGREKVREAAEFVKEKATDKINTGKSESASLSKKEAEDLAKSPEDSKKKNDIENSYQTKSTIKQMKQAAVGAASISAIMSGTYNTVRYCKMVKDGIITEEAAVYKIIAETASSAADSAIKASAVTGAQSLLVRYGSKELVGKLTEQSLRGMMHSSVVTVGVVCAVDAVKDLVKVGSGKITIDEFYDRQGKNVLNTTAGTMGGAVGYSVGVAAATSLGYAAGSTSLVLMGALGGISGGLIAGMAMQIAIENHIEKSYSDMVRNTENLHQSMLLLEQISVNMFQGQLIFTEFLKEEERLDKNFAEKINNINVSGLRMSSAIDSI